MNSLTFRYTVFDDRVLPRTPLEKLMQYVVKEPYLLPWNNPKHSKIQNAGRPRKLWMRNRELCHAVGVAGRAAPQRQRHPGSCQQPSTQAPMPTASLQRRRAEHDAGLELTLPPLPPGGTPPLCPHSLPWDRSGLLPQDTQAHSCLKPLPLAMGHTLPWSLQTRLPVIRVST